ncbi:DoxX family protein [Erythrobacter sp. SDW2]|uniref:DoxX family protein n=1 Tax=Erythrobacter sp. SDW2 TaxID=2907154 RepID=UPI001F169286|nr:DoxX family protein [Erythrobacter sp. SDW2]UIP07744.1 DoxX family protein [Erythrobacter sp. SDW2]
MIRTGLRWLLAIFYLAAGIAHLRSPEFFLAIMPPWVPMHAEVVLWTGVAEIAGAIGLAQPLWPSLRRAAAIGLAGYAVCVFPANVHHFALDMAREDGGLGLAYHVPRMFAQPVIIWLALWVGEATDWPFPRPTN